MAGYAGPAGFQGQYPSTQGGPPQAGAHYPPPAGGQYHVQPAGQYPVPAEMQQAYDTGSGQAVSAPPPGSFEKADGYRDISFKGGLVRPPTQQLPSAPPPDQPSMDVHQEPLTRGEVKEALAAFVAQHCCYGSEPIKNMEISNIIPSATCKYSLETFIEKRETKWKFEPWKGDNIATSGVSPPGPWNIPITPKKLFEPEKRVLEVPHTQSLRPCFKCQAQGDQRCKHCSGKGRDPCSPCGGNGIRHQEQCSWCSGTGTTQCTWCRGRGMVKCSTCDGERNLKYYVELTVTWEVHGDKYVMETVGLPDDEVKRVSGDTVCQAQGLFVWPFSGFPEDQIAHSSQHLVKKHQTGWPMARILQQRHDVQLIPIHTIMYRYRTRNGTFFVCGHEKNVYFPDYPSRCCGCCCCLL